MTGRALISVADDGENHIVVVPGANAAVSVAHVDRHHTSVERARVVLAQLEIPLVAVEAALRAAAAGVTTILNATPPLPLDAAVLGLVDVLVVNEHEAAALAGGSVSSSTEASDAGRCAAGAGCGVVVVTLGQ